MEKTIILAIITLLFPAFVFAEVTFYANFNRTVSADDIADPNSWAELSMPSQAAGNPAAVVSTAAGSLIPGSYQNPRGAWLSPGIYIAEYGGIRYEAIDNVSSQTATMEFYSDKDFCQMSSSQAKPLTVFFGQDDYIDFYIEKLPLDNYRIGVYAVLDGNAVELAVDYNCLTSTGSADGFGFNHFLLSYDLTEPLGSRWMGLWINGYCADFTTKDVFNNDIGTFSSDTSINQLTIGNDYSADPDEFDSDFGFEGNIDAVRIHSSSVYGVYELDGNNDFSVAGILGAEYLTYDQPTSFYLNFNNHVPDVNVVCTPVIAMGDPEPTLLGNPLPDADHRLFGAWGTPGISFYWGNTGLHYAAIDNVPRNNGTIEWYNNRFLPDCAASGEYPRLMEVAWDDNYTFRAYIDDPNTTEEYLRLAIRVNMGDGPEYFTAGEVDIPVGDFPYDSRLAGGSGMNHYALSWKGSSGYDVPDGWMGLWINGQKVMKFTLNYPYFWGSGDNIPGNNIFAIGIFRRYPYMSSSSLRLGGAWDGIRVSALAVDELYELDANESFELLGYIGNEYGKAPPSCRQPGTIYLAAD